VNIKQLIERTYLDTRKETPVEFGEYVADGVPKRRAVRSAHSGRERSSLGRPEGTLISHLTEHSGAIVGLCVSPDSVFFASGSEDGSVKVWDSMRLEKNVTARSRLSIHMGARVTALCALQHSHCVACASENGIIQIYRIDVNLSSTLPKYSKQHLVRQYVVDEQDVHATSLLHYEIGESVTSALCESDCAQTPNRCWCVPHPTLASCFWMSRPCKSLPNCRQGDI
jgi:phosphoinositide-3-kinase regulatory subunit 4